MTLAKPVRYSLLDLSPIVADSTAAESFRNSLDLARHAERWGYHRYWLAEHHNMPGIASAATAVVIAHVAAGTRTIRVGAGGIMLPNHAPLVVAEQFGEYLARMPGAELDAADPIGVPSTMPGRTDGDVLDAVAIEIADRDHHPAELLARLASRPVP